jgi:hypothetical protein
MKYAALENEEDAAREKGGEKGPFVLSPALRENPGGPERAELLGSRIRG